MFLDAAKPTHLSKRVFRTVRPFRRFSAPPPPELFMLLFTRFAYWIVYGHRRGNTLRLKY